MSHVNIKDRGMRDKSVAKIPLGRFKKARVRFKLKEWSLGQE